LWRRPRPKLGWGAKERRKKKNPTIKSNSAHGIHKMLDSGSEGNMMEY